MDRRFSLRKDEMLAECEVSPQVFQGMVGRLMMFLEPFVQRMVRPEQRQHALTVVRGLLSDLSRKNVESIAYRDDQDRGQLQHFVGVAEWDHRPLQQALVRQVGGELGQEDGVIVFDPSAFAKQGTQSVGVARQWCGRLGKVDNCQVGVYMGYVSREEHALVDMRLYLPQDWARDRARRKRAGVPSSVRFQTRHQQALEMLEENGSHLPHAWVAGDDEFGQAAEFRRDLHECGETYLLAVPSDITIRDLEAQPPPYQGRGAVPKRAFEQVRQWCAAREESEWTRVFVRDGEKGPLEVALVTCRVEAKLKRRRMPYEEMLVVIRYVDEEGVRKIDYYLSNAAVDTPLRELARVSKAAHRIEECIKRCKSEAGLADYEVRNWKGWHHHQVLSLLACWFLITESRRGKKTGSGADGSSTPRRPRAAASRGPSLRHTDADRPRNKPPSPTKRTRPLLSPQNT
jgi:SRSO17 transposase